MIFKYKKSYTRCVYGDTYWILLPNRIQRLEMHQCHWILKWAIILLAIQLGFNFPLNQRLQHEVAFRASSFM